MLTIVHCILKYFLIAIYLYIAALPYLVIMNGIILLVVVVVASLVLPFLFLTPSHLPSPHLVHTPPPRLPAAIDNEHVLPSVQKERRPDQMWPVIYQMGRKHKECCLPSVDAETSRAGLALQQSSPTGKLQRKLICFIFFLLFWPDSSSARRVSCNEAVRVYI